MWYNYWYQKGKKPIIWDRLKRKGGLSLRDGGSIFVVIGILFLKLNLFSVMNIPSKLTYIFWEILCSVIWNNFWNKHLHWIDKSVEMWLGENNESEEKVRGRIDEM